MIYLDTSDGTLSQSLSSNGITITTISGSSSTVPANALHYTPPPITFTKDYVKAILDIIEQDTELSNQFSRIIASSLHNE